MSVSVAEIEREAQKNSNIRQKLPAWIDSTTAAFIRLWDWLLPLLLPRHGPSHGSR